MHSFIAARRSAAALVGGVALALYLITLAPTITWANFGADGGDLITAAVTSGVPHPPGYPLYTTVGYMFAQLPIGTVAFRLNLFSAVGMALAAALTTWSVMTPTPALPRPQKAADREGSGLPASVDSRVSTGERLKTPAASAGAGIGVLAGLSFAAAPMVWGQATMAEVHALNALFVALILAILNPIVFHGEPVSSRQLSLAFFIWGLGLTNQLTLLALVPFFFIAVRRSLITRHASHLTRYSSLRSIPVGLVTRCVLPVLLALASYLLLLSRAAAQPPINWLGEVTPANFWSLITAEIYHGYAFGLPWSDYPARLTAFAQLLVAQFGWIGLGLIGLGLWRAGQRAIAPLISSALYVIFALGYRTVDSQLYLIPVWLFGAWAIAAGARPVAQCASLVTRRREASRRDTSLVILALIALMPGLSVLSNFAAQDLHADHAAEQFALRVLTAAPADALLITHVDAHTFTLWYYRLVERLRPDITVIDARLAGYSWYDPMLHAQDAWPAQNPTLRNITFDPEDTWLTRLRAANPARPVCDLDPATAQLRCA